MDDIAAVKSKISDRNIVRKGTGEAGTNESTDKEKRLRKTCTDFESIFFYYVFKGMRQTIPQSSFLKQTPGKDTYNVIFDQKVAEEMANKRERSGLQQTLFEQLNNR